LVRHAPTKGDRVYELVTTGFRGPDSLPFLSCRPWFVAVAHHTGKELTLLPLHAPCDLCPRCLLPAFHLGDTYTFFNRVERKINMKINGFQSRKRTFYGSRVDGKERTKGSSKTRELSLRAPVENSPHTTRP
jgi:hypothetical protein